VSELDRSYNLSLTQPNAGNISHAFNYMLPVYHGNGSDVAFRLWFLDSGEDTGCFGVRGYDCVRPDQIEWFRQAHYQIPATDPSKGRGILFMHISIPEYTYLYNNMGFYGHRGETSYCQPLNTGLFGAMKEQKTVEWVTVGHDHNNDFHGNYDGINLAYGRKTGYACYGPDGILHGARVFEYAVSESGINSKTWIRQEDGSVKDYNVRVQRGIFDQPQTMCGKAEGKAASIDPNDEKLAKAREYYVRLGEV